MPIYDKNKTTNNCSRLPFSLLQKIHTCVDVAMLQIYDCDKWLFSLRFICIRRFGNVLAISSSLFSCFPNKNISHIVSREGGNIALRSMKLAILYPETFSLAYMKLIHEVIQMGNDVISTTEVMFAFFPGKH